MKVALGDAGRSLPPQPPPRSRLISSEALVRLEDHRMMIEPRKQDLAASKEIKVKIPVHHHLRLHALKVLEGQQISVTIERALDAWFEGRRGEADVEGLE